MDINELQAILKAQYPTMDAILIHREDLVFEERVKLKCYQCRNYNTKWSCPGKLPQIDFRKVISEYTNMAVIIYKKSAVRNQKSEVRDQKSEDDYRAASNELHRAMLYLEAEMMKRNNPLAQSFIGGYCALCKDACPPDKCAHPEQARISWDATGCNVMRSLANIGVQVDFTGKDVQRFGLFVW